MVAVVKTELVQIKKRLYGIFLCALKYKRFKGRSNKLWKFVLQVSLAIRHTEGIIHFHRCLRKLKKVSSLLKTQTQTPILGRDIYLKKYINDVLKCIEHPLITLSVDIR